MYIKLWYISDRPYMSLRLLMFCGGFKVDVYFSCKFLFRGGWFKSNSFTLSVNIIKSSFWRCHWGALLTWWWLYNVVGIALAGYSEVFKIIRKLIYYYYGEGPLWVAPSSWYCEGVLLYSYLCVESNWMSCNLLCHIVLSKAPFTAISFLLLHSVSFDFFSSYAY